ncbi:cobalt-precorrin-6A reductase [Rhodococcus aerolatus]
MSRVLLLGGTAEARTLAAALDGRAEVVTSLAGRVADPVLPAGEVRVGGFGGTAGLVRWLRERPVGAVVDATHPFAATMTEHAVAAALQVGVPLLRLSRAPWAPVAGDRWHDALSLVAASEVAAGLGGRLLLTTGRRSLGAFLGVPGRWVLLRSVDPPDGPVPADVEVLLDRGPFTVAGERELMRSRRVEVVVTKNSGGAMTAAKLVAARELGLPVVVVQRPSASGAVPTAEVSTVEAALDWLAGRGLA